MNAELQISIYIDFGDYSINVDGPDFQQFGGFTKEEAAAAIMSYAREAVRKLERIEG